MKMRIVPNEISDLWTLEQPSNTESTVYEITDELFARYTRIMDELFEIQETLEKIAYSRIYPIEIP